MKSEGFVLKSAGHPDGNLIAEICNGRVTGVRCGKIENGVGMHFEGERGGWVVDAQDILGLAELISLERDKWRVSVTQE